MPRLLADKEKLKIALLNIIINAVEAMQPAKGVLKLDVKLINGLGVISIADNGKGIERKILKNCSTHFIQTRKAGWGSD